MVRQHHHLNGHEFEQAPGDREGQGSLVFCSSWGHKVRYDLVTEQQHHWKQTLHSDLSLNLGSGLNSSLIGFISVALLPGGSVVKNLPANPWVKKLPWRRKWQPTALFLPGKSHGQRILVGYSP